MNASGTPYLDRSRIIPLAKAASFSRKLLAKAQFDVIQEHQAKALDRVEGFRIIHGVSPRLVSVAEAGFR